MTSKKSIQKSFNYIKETCPKVDEITDNCRNLLHKIIQSEFINTNKLSAELYDELYDHINDCFKEVNDNIKKEVTYKMREAINDACSEIIELEDKTQDLEDEISKLKSSNEELSENLELEKDKNNELKQLNDELEESINDYKQAA